MGLPSWDPWLQSPRPFVAGCGRHRGGLVPLLALRVALSSDFSIDLPPCRSSAHADE